MRDSILKSVFMKSDNTVGWSKWIKLTLLESYMGEQILELLLAWASFTQDTDFDGFIPASSNGYKTQDLEDFIPATLINRWLLNSIKDLIETKYLNHYGVLRKTIDSEYEIDTNKLYLLTELRLAHNTIWVGINLIIDIIVYIASGNLLAALTTGAFIEFIRRFKF